MIGFYNYTVILTYGGLLTSIFGIFLTFNHHFLAAMFCLVISGICDMFDGIVARSCKNRSDEAKIFGIQIDSLCDLICFGVFPGIFNYIFTLNFISNSSKFRFAAMVSSALLILCAVIRLGYFNVMEMIRQKETAESRKYYQGLPVTSIAGFLPLLFTFRELFGSNIFYIVLNIFTLLVAFFFVLDFKVPKPHKKGIIVMSVCGMVMLTALALQGLKIL